MPIDPSIAMGYRPTTQLEDPSNQLAKILGIQQAQQALQSGEQAMQANRLKFDEYQRGVDRGNRLRSLLQGMGDATPEQRIEGLRKTGEFLSEADTMEKGFLERRKAESDVQKNRAEAFSKLGKVQGELATRVFANPSMESAEAAVNAMEFAYKQLGFDTTPIAAERQLLAKMTTPEQLKQWAAGHALSAEKMLPQTFESDLGGTKPYGTVNPLTGARTVLGTNTKTQTPDSAASVAATMRGQNMTDARARAQLEQAERHFQVNQGKEAKMTEDQGKATGWLIQAENAWKNMQDALKNTPDAAKPGFTDALAAIPSMGFTSAVANSLRSADRQKFMQATSSLSEALLRAATGAGVNKDEAEQKIKELTPVFGEKDENTQQKLAAIPLYIESLKVRAGPGAKSAAAVLSAPSASKLSPAEQSELEALRKQFNRK